MQLCYLLTKLKFSKSFGLVLSNDKRTNFGTTIVVIKNQEVVNAIVVKIVIKIPFVSIKLLLKKYIDKNHKFKELMYARNKVKTVALTLDSISNILWKFNINFIYCVFFAANKSACCLLGAVSTSSQIKI
jgi:hypothetical protein